MGGQTPINRTSGAQIRGARAADIHKSSLKPNFGAVQPELPRLQNLGSKTFCFLAFPDKPAMDGEHEIHRLSRPWPTRCMGSFWSDIFFNILIFLFKPSIRLTCLTNGRAPNGKALLSDTTPPNLTENATKNGRNRSYLPTYLPPRWIP